MYLLRQRLLPLVLVSIVLLVGFFAMVGLQAGGEAKAQTVPPTPTDTPTREPTPTRRPRPQPTATPRIIIIPATPEVVTATPEPEPEEEEDAAQPPAQPAQSGIATGVFTAWPLAPQPLTLTITGTDDPATVNRFLRYMLAGYGPMGGELTATIGALPPGLPISFTLPADVTVVGGYVRRGDFEDDQVFLSGGESTEALIETLRQDFVAQGYTTPGTMDAAMSGQVFLSNDPIFPDILCSADQQYVIFLSALNLVNEPPAARININRAVVGDVCSQGAYPGGMATGILPQLTPPPNAQVRGSGMGSGGTFVSADAEIQTDMPVADLAAHYTAQLAAAGWEQLDASSAAAVEWSAWRFTDEQGNTWTATFFIAQRGDSPNAFFTTLRADADQNQ